MKTLKVRTEDHASYDVKKRIDNMPSKKSDVDLLSDVTGMFKSECLEAINKHGSLHGVAKNTDMLDSCLELSKRYIYEELERGDALCSPAQTRQFLQLQLADYPHEVFAVLFLDNRNRVIAFEKMFRGTIDGASVYPREVAKEALNNNAAAVIFAHNHPSGVAEPSHADETITARLKQALALVDIRVLDHFVIGDEIVSFAERGLL